MPRYMLDTDTSSLIMNYKDVNVFDRLQRVGTSDVCISIISKCEMLFGIEKSPEPTRHQAALDHYLRYITVVDFSGDAALHYAQIRAALRRGGNMIGANDIFIAAHARSLGLTLVTNNTREFNRVDGLRIENWTRHVS
jgi:tRNA(fMet)-specific endonuclease VapC